MNKWIYVLPVFFLGCQYIRETIGMVPRKPKVALEKIKVVKFAPSQIELSLNIKVHNPNFFAIHLSDLKYEAFANQKKVAEGEHKESIRVPSGEQGKFALPVTVSIPKPLQFMKELVQSGGNLQLEWKGEAYFNSPLGKIKIKIDQDRMISLLP